jgi:YD repeat-containing protein
MKIGYKATENYRCRDQVYEIGQEYKMNELPIICHRGFHYCEVAKNVLKHYAFTPGFKLLEIEDLSEDTVWHYDKSCSNHIRIVREITDPEELYKRLQIYRKFDERGNLILHKNESGYVCEYTYNDQGKELTYKNSNGFWRKKTYNKNGHFLTSENSFGGWSKATYDEKHGGELIYEDSRGYRRESSYDEIGRFLGEVVTRNY